MNLMKIKTLFAIVLLGIAVAANGQVVSQAYEVALSDFRAPATENGSAAFKECGECERRLVRVTAATHYSINGKSLRLADFRKTITHTRNRGGVAVTVLHHLESDTIESIAVSL